MSGESSLTLFGLNLESHLTGLRLGMRQLLWGHESGVWHSLYPRAQILYRGSGEYQDVAGFMEINLKPRLGWLCSPMTWF